MKAEADIGETRWKERLAVTVAVALGFVLFFPMFVCGCHFHAVALLPNALPVGWGFYALFSHRGGKERVVGWVAFLLALLALWIGFEGNVRFLW